MKRQFGITYTVEMGAKAYKLLCGRGFAAEEAEENNPEWDAGLAAVRCLRDDYGVKAKLVRWGFRRNADDVARQK